LSLRIIGTLACWQNKPMLSVKEGKFCRPQEILNWRSQAGVEVCCVVNTY